MNTATLPKWAQAKIAQLERELTYVSKQLVAATEAQGWKNQDFSGVTPINPLAPVRWMNSDGRDVFEVRWTNQGTWEIRTILGVMAISPQAANAIQVASVAL